MLIDFITTGVVSSAIILHAATLTGRPLLGHLPLVAVGAIAGFTLIGLAVGTQSFAGDVILAVLGALITVTGGAFLGRALRWPRDRQDLFISTFISAAIATTGLSLLLPRIWNTSVWWYLLILAAGIALPGIAALRVDRRRYATGDR